MKSTYLFIFLFIFTSCQEQKLAEVDNSESFRSYYYNLNLAIDAKNKNADLVYKKAIRDAFNDFPKQDKVPFPYYILARFINTQEFEDTTALINFLKKQRAVAGTRNIYLDELNEEIRPFAEKYQEIIALSNLSA